MLDDSDRIGFLESYLQFADDFCHHIIFAGYQHVASSITPILSLCFSLVIIGYGLALWRGAIQMPLSVATNKALKVGVGIAFVHNWAFFSEHFAMLLTNGPDELAGMVISAFNRTDAGLVQSNGSLSHMAQLSFNNVLSMVGELFKNSGLMGFTVKFSGLILFVVIILLFSYAFTLLIISKLGLAVLLILAPLFIVLSWFKATEGMSQLALNSAVGFALMPSFISAALMISVGILDYGIQLERSIDAGNKMGMQGASVMIVGGILCLPLLMQMKQLAAHIASGIAIDTQGAVQQAQQRFILNPLNRISNQLKVRGR